MILQQIQSFKRRLNDQPLFLVFWYPKLKRKGGKLIKIVEDDREYCLAIILSILNYNFQTLSVTMYRKNVQPTTNASNLSKKTNKSTDRSIPIPDKRQQTHTDFKSKDQQLMHLIKEHLQFAGYLRAFETVKNERPNLKAKAQIGSHQPPKHELDKNTVMSLFDRGSRQEFFRVTSKMWGTTDEIVKKLQFQIQVYFCIYNVHPNLKRQATMDHASSVAFKKYLQTRSAELAVTKQQLALFAMPYMPKPQENPALAQIFTKDWITRTRSKMVQFHQNYLKSSNMSQQSSNIRKVSALQQIYYSHLNNSINSSREEFKQNCNQTVEIEALRQQNSQLRIIIENYHKKFDQFAQSSKQNLYESNQKWFLFSRDLFNIARKYIKEDKVKMIEKYQSFFVGNIEDLIDANQISLFDKNSYMYDDLSVNPDLSKNKIPLKKPDVNVSNPCQLDLNKIKSLFLQSNQHEKEIEICSVLRALKNRFNKNTNSVKRREIIVEYSRGDICGIKEQNYIVQKRLFFDGGQRIREFFVKLIEVITTDVIGLQYLNKSKKLVENLVGIFSTEKQENKCFKPIVGILQRLSFSKEPRQQMISLGIIPMIFKVFKNEGNQLSGFTLQFLTAMMMNLSLKRESKPDFEKHKTELINIVIQHMASDNNQVRDYINGSIFLLLTSKPIKEEALKQKLDLIVKNLLETRENDMCSQQYTYILKRLTGEEEGDLCQESDSEDQEEAEMEEYEEYEEDEDYGSISASSEDDYLQGQIEIANGEEMLFKNYALLGPEAVREHILTRSVLDETSKRLNNMTTSINRSRRMDNIFVQKGNVTVLEPELDRLLNRKKG